MGKVSMKCGTNKCENWNSNSESKCSIYSDRRECKKSMQQRKCVVNINRKRQIFNWL
jgi:hypothetical protein